MYKHSDTESGMDFKSESWSLGLYPQHIFKKSSMVTTGKWRDCSKLTCASLDCGIR